MLHPATALTIWINVQMICILCFVEISFVLLVCCCRITLENNVFTSQMENLFSKAISVFNYLWKFSLNSFGLPELMHMPVHILLPGQVERERVAAGIALAVASSSQLR